MIRPTEPRRAILALLGLALALSSGPGCSDPGQETESEARQRRINDFRVVKFAKAQVVVPFRSDLTLEPVPPEVAGFAPKGGDRVVLADRSDGEVFLARDLEALRFYHSDPSPDLLGRFRLLADEGRLFVVPRGTAGSVKQVVEAALPGGVRAIEIQLSKKNDETAWVSDPFARQAGAAPK